MTNKQWLLSPRQLCRFALLALLGLVGEFCASANAPGVVHGWGDYHAIGKPVGLADAIDCKAANTYSYALRSDGTVALWGSGPDGELDVPPGLTNVVGIAAGYYMGMALTGFGRVQVWGAGGHVSHNEIVNPPA